MYTDIESLCFPFLPCRSRRGSCDKDLEVSFSPTPSDTSEPFSSGSSSNLGVGVGSLEELEQMQSSSFLSHDVLHFSTPPPKHMQELAVIKYVSTAN
jgi:hypothetical protein